MYLRSVAVQPRGQVRWQGGIRKFDCPQVGSMMGGGVRVDVCEDMDDGAVVADLPGVEPENIAVRILSPTELRISGARCS